MSELFDFAADITGAHFSGPSHPGRRQILVECEYYALDVSYYLVGSFFAATETNPADYPEIVVTGAILIYGDLRLPLTARQYDSIPEADRVRVDEDITEQEFGQ